MRYSLAELAALPDHTNWDRVNALTEEEIEEAARSDPDWEGLLDLDWTKAEVVVPPKKVAISIRVDEDVLAFFKSGGEGYQKRINAVLRSYVTQTAGQAQAARKTRGGDD